MSGQRILGTGQRILGTDGTDGGGCAPPARVAVRSGVRPLEVWRTADGRVLLHQPGRGREQDWIEVLPEAFAWLARQLTSEAAEETEFRRRNSVLLAK